MTISRRKALQVAGAAFVLPTALRAQEGGGTVHEVQMLNRDPETGDTMVYKPAVLQVEPGDTVRFVPTDPGHNSESTEGGIPEGAEEWSSDINEEFEITLDAEGPYAYNCRPHNTAGMVGIILVGQVDSLDPLRELRLRGRAAQRWDDYLAEAETMMAGDA